jgi:2-polyprenyl-6-methoxyphenol hydroxylase-like FAD-dependent oxidoreductase
VQDLPILVVGAGIGGLSAAIALRRAGHRVTIIEKDPTWSVYGVGIIQQSNVIRAMDQLGVLDAFLDAACGFDAVEIYIPDGTRVARVPTPSLVEGRPSNVGIGRRALQRVLGDSARELGAEIRLGLTVAALDEDADGVTVTFSDGSTDRFAVVVGADGVYSQVRQTILPDAEKPQFTGQAVWRYNFPRPADLDALHVYNGAPAWAWCRFRPKRCTCMSPRPSRTIRAIPRKVSRRPCAASWPAPRRRSRRSPARSPTTKAWSIVRWKA